MTLRTTALIAVAASLCFSCNLNSENQAKPDNEQAVENLSRKVGSIEDFKVADTIAEPQQIPDPNTTQNVIPSKPVD